MLDSIVLWNKIKPQSGETSLMFEKRPEGMRLWVYLGQECSRQGGSKYEGLEAEV